MVIARFLKSNKMALIIMLLLLLIVLSPLAVYAIWGSHSYIGMSGVYNSNLYVGTHGQAGQLFIGYSAGSLNYASGAGSVINLIPLIFISLAVMLLVTIGFSDEVNITTIIIGAIIIFMALAFLAGINSEVSSILGGVIK